MTTPHVGDGPELVPIHMSPAQQRAWNELGYDYPAASAEQQDMRLKRCGLVWHEDQLTSNRWVGPPDPPPPGSDYRVKVLPLFMVKPVPGMQIAATDGEKYLLPPDFKGD